VQRNDPPPDRELLRRSRAGDGGFETFYRRHRESILAYHAQRVRDSELAADLTAETFAAALEAAHNRRRRLPDYPVAWLFTIAHNKLLDSIRRGRVEADARRHLEFERLHLQDKDLARIEEIANDVDLVARLKDQLPRAQFQALEARVLDERAYDEIAQELGCSEEVVRMRVSRALKALRSKSEGSS
jgi:RNA polymerase sigma factor (sigma-70 family)